MAYYTAIVTLVAVVIYFIMATRVAWARGKFGVKHPATTGDPGFERIFRAHVNTLEWMPTFLVPLWLCAVYFSDRAAAVAGLLWIAGRIVFHRLQQGCGEAAARLLHSIDRVPAADHGCGSGHCHAFVTCTAAAAA